MLEFLFELVFEFLGELVLQLGAEWLGAGFRAGWQKLTGRSRDTSAAQEVAWSLLTGAVAGAVTLALFPHLMIAQRWLQGLNLVLAPVAAGFLVERVRAWREGRGLSSAVRWPVFAYAALFGLAFAVTRWMFAG